MMAFSERDLESYVDVAQRIADFREQYPTGCLQPADPANPWELATAMGRDRNGEEVAQTFVVYVAAAYRTPDDPRPGIGCAWEVFPGRTPYTRGSELQNAETSAWGRAIVAVLASDTKQGVASRQEVAARRAERDDGLPVNADGSLSRSRTTDAEKEAAGVMTEAQQAEHSALRAEECPICHDIYVDLNDHLKTSKKPGHLKGPALGQLKSRPPDPWQDQPAGSLPESVEYSQGSITPAQQRAIMKLYGGQDRPVRLATISELAGRTVTSTNDLSYVEAQRVLASGKAAK